MAPFTHLLLLCAFLSLHSFSLAATKSCSATDITCPECNNAHVTDHLGTEYQVHCDHILFSEKSYAVQEDLSANGCMDTCDNYTWCGGSTYWMEGVQGNCELARGKDVFPLQKKSFTAFLLVDTTFTTAATVGAPAPFPTQTPKSIFTTTEKSQTKHMPTSSHMAAQSPSPGSCDEQNVRCPQCNGFTLEDGFDTPYRVQCNFEPICNDITGIYGDVSANSCLEHCDLDPTCLAATYQNQHCNLCQGALYGLVTYQAPHEYVAFIAEPLLNASKPTTTQEPAWSLHSLHSFSVPTRAASNPSALPGKSTRHQVSSVRSSLVPKERTSTHSAASSQSTTGSSTGSPTTVNINSVSCPADDNLDALVSTNDRSYQIFCDKALLAAFANTVSVSNFAQCAQACSLGCGGVELVSQTACTLLNQVTGTYSRPGFTAGLYSAEAGFRLGTFATTMTLTTVTDSVPFFSSSATQTPPIKPLTLHTITDKILSFPSTTLITQTSTPSVAGPSSS